LEVIGMNSELTLAFQDIERNAGLSVLRLALCRGEALRIPRSRKGLRVLSGTAWVTIDGDDILLQRGDAIELDGRLRGARAVVSVVDGETLLFEAW
jgi:hypothetical protein